MKAARPQGKEDVFLQKPYLGRLEMNVMCLGEAENVADARRYISFEDAIGF
jgi:hypothetical protein